MTAGSIAVPTIVPLRAPTIGKLKNVIDTNVPIELRTETPNAEIFFTIDGSKPDPFAALGADRSTIKYTKPFRLRTGKITVKAIALSRDGTRESHIVTKTFDVEKPDEKENRLQKTGSFKLEEYEFIDDLEKERKKEIIKKRGILKKLVDSNNISFRSDGGSLSDNESSRYHNQHHHHTHHHHGNNHHHKDEFLHRSMSKTDDYSAHMSSHLNRSTSNAIAIGNEYDVHSTRKIMLPDSSMQTLRLQRETDFLKCAYCFASRPQDPHAKYCQECGKSLPHIPSGKFVQPDSAKLGTCFFCKSTVPLNTSICVICENPIQPHLQPQAAIKLQGKVTCPSCFSQNPVNYTTCVVCEAKLMPGAKVHPVDLSIVVPQHPVPAGKSYTCNQCFRINRNDARFCDWCGAKPKREIGPLSCNRCSAINNPYSKFCSSCGSIIQSTASQNSSAALFASVPKQSAWLSHIDSKANHILNKEYSTVATQTYGLFYISSKGMENKIEKDDKTIRLEKEFLEKKPPLTATSAGRGYWRQQMDHICAHLKAFAHNNTEFRAIIAEPRLGKIDTAKVDIDSNYCTITASFPIRSNSRKDSFNGSSTADRDSSIRHRSHLTQNDYDMMAAVVAGRGSSLEEDSVTEEESYRSDIAKPKKVRKKRPTEKNEIKMTGEDRQLLKELGKSGRGRPHEVENLLREGANPNSTSKDGLNALHNALRYRHLDCIPILIKAGAEKDAKIPPRNNSLLHEAVLMGPEASSIIKMLLDYGANPNLKNSKNETPFDVAIKENNSAAVNILGAQVGDNMIQAYLKTKSN